MRGAGKPGPAAPLLDAVPDPVILVDRQGLVVAANAAALTLLPGIREGHPLVFGLRDPAILDGVAAVLAQGRPVQVEHRRRGAPAGVFEVRIGPRGGALPLNTPSEAALVFRDVTAARRLEQMRADFVANASHELRTPLASLLGFIDTLEGPARDDPAARARFLGIMREQAERMRRLVDDLLSLSRIELLEHVRPRGEVDLLALAGGVVEALRPLAEGQGRTVTLAGAGAGAAPVRGDRDDLVRLIENLVENAIKHGRAGGQVAVQVAAREARPAEIELLVADDGPGIAPEHLPRLTERFYRADSGRGGTGLGLAIAKHIVARHRGRLAIESRPGEGTWVRVALPAGDAG